ncbi:xanthine dehydrogenase [Tieghemostelium lacteum]|uniref:xanthine dehydrogenase n=1 Tax=Tieghemostelium lacteum TaxID=361077 RepID=A0A151Z533_TIELA|nr:xanthine dehydrogenase [Tieghemostelium lacteum]|eukprot:KYQ89070.1 xanthine dehydrogenase [Tieghemostelium lacteum]
MDFKEVKNELIFFLNGEKVVINQPNPELTLLQYVRSIGLTGSKLGCGEGGCGACTVMISHYSQKQDHIIHRSVNACLFPLCAAAGCAVVTIEGLGNVRDGLHPVQSAISEANGSQCGFCTPGIVMALYSYLRSNPNATKHDIEESFDGNLCRCTGYRPLLDAAKSFSVDDFEVEKEVKLPSIATGESEDTKSDGVMICPGTGKPCDCKKKTTHIPSKPLDLKAEPIFPPFLMSYHLPSLEFKGPRVTWYTPSTFDELLKLKALHGNAKIVVGNTEIGIETKFRNVVYPVIISPTRVAELNQISSTDDGIHLGASVTLSEFRQYLQSENNASGNAHKHQTSRAILSQLKWFAGNQIRNAACIGGNLATASPISDLNPVLLAVGAIITLVSHDENGQVVERKCHIENFFLKYRVVDIKPQEVIKSVFIPYTRDMEFVEAYKQSRRRDDDIAIVSCCFRVFFEKVASQDTQFKIKECVFAYGGMNIKAVTSPKTQEYLKGRVWSQSDLTEIYNLLEQDLPLAPNAPGGMIEYRKSLTISFFFKYFIAVSQQLYAISNDAQLKFDDRELSASKKYSREISRGEQTYQNHPTQFPITEALKHQSADKQVTGEAIYTDDIPITSLYAAKVMSAKAYANIKSIDASKALQAPGVKAFYTYKDIPGANQQGPVFQDEEILVSKQALFMGHALGVIIAETHQQALEASKMVVVEYEELVPILTIEDAIAQNSYLNCTHIINDGDYEKGFQESKHILEGEIYVGGQEHFYLETQGTLAVPGEGDELTIYASTQNPMKTQSIVSYALGIPANQVVCKLKRMGGGFGGKETRSVYVSCLASLAAHKLKKPVRMILDRDTDMITSGSRHPFLGRYKIGFNDEGRIHSALIQLYADAGYSFDLSIGVLDRAMFHSENAYKIPNFTVIGKLCKTNLPTNTAFRGFGGPQGMIICENWVERIAHFLKKPSKEIREINFYKEHDITHYKQEITNCQLQRVWSEIQIQSQYQERLAGIDQFNKENRWKKRGISLIPTKFGMSFTVKTLNQAGALVHLYTDGSVLVSHGGTEMGQGLHTKIIQIAAREMGVPVDKVFISETSTDKVANTAPTAASVSSDMNGMAVLYACQQINERLKPLREKNPTFSVKQIANLAYAERINLSANGFYATPNVGYIFKDSGVGEGTPFNYFSYGAACSEVEVDLLTGDHTILRTDIVMDVGESLNPAIDIGQVEGAFVQGVGWCTLEEVVTFKPSGYMFTRGPSTYKIPGFNDVPLVFNVSLLNNSPNHKAIHSSKGVGEPPLFLGSSVYFALRHAITEARKESKLVDWFDLSSPLTCERIRNSCIDKFTLQFSKK